jgi:hypothetical protein
MLLNINSYIYYDENIYLVSKINDNDITIINLGNNTILVIPKKSSYKLLDIKTPVELRNAYILIKKKLIK